MKRMWNRLYGKVRADLAGTLATGGLGVAVLWVLDYFGHTLTPEQQVSIVAATGYLGGKIAAYIRPETGPVIVTPTPPPMDGDPENR